MADRKKEPWEYDDPPEGAGDNPPRITVGGKKKEPWEYDDPDPPPAGAGSIPLPPVAGIGKDAPPDTSRLNLFQRMDKTGLPWERGAKLPVRDLTLGETPQPNTSAPMLPMSYDEKGRARWDSNAGILGDAKRFFELVHDTRLGKVDPMSDDSIAKTNAFSVLMGPGGSKGMTVAAGRTPVHPTGAFSAPQNLPGYGARNIPPGQTVVASNAPNAMFGARARGAATPTSAELEQVAASGTGVGYNELRNRGIRYDPPAVGQALDDTAQAAMTGTGGKGVLPSAAGGVHGGIQDLRNQLQAIAQNLRRDPTATAHLPYDAADTLRQRLSELRMSPSRDEGIAASAALRNWTGFMGRGAPGDLAPGSRGVGAVHNGPPVSEALARNNANWAAAQRGGVMDDILQSKGKGNFTDRAEARLQQVNTPPAGQPPGTPPVGWTPQEAAQLARTERGGPVRNVLGWTGDFLGAGSPRSLGSAMLGTGALGGYGGGLWGTALALVPPVVGGAAKAGENALAKRSIRRMGDTLRQRSPEFQDRAAYMREHPVFTDPLVKALTARASANRTQPWYEDEAMKRRIAAGEVI